MLRALADDDDGNRAGRNHQTLPREASVLTAPAGFSVTGGFSAADDDLVPAAASPRPCGERSWVSGMAEDSGGGAKVSEALPSALDATPTALSFQAGLTRALGHWKRYYTSQVLHRTGTVP
jgi:hypothetical protein